MFNTFRSDLYMYHTALLLIVYNKAQIEENFENFEIVRAEKK